MQRYELVEGNSSKFWEVEIKEHNKKKKKILHFIFLIF